MFEFSDPTGGNLLDSAGAISDYRATLQSEYRDGAKRINSAFTLLSAFDAIDPNELLVSSVEWQAFPRSVNQTDVDIDQARVDFQDEYVEWRVERDGQGKVTRITFTTEFPEYYEALAAVDMDAVIDGIQEVIPGAQPSVEDLFGPGFDPQSVSPERRARRFRSFATSPGSGPIRNPWNNGARGILCLAQRFNTLTALFNLVIECGVPRPPSTNSADTCAAVGNFCGPGRNSDPVVCTATQDFARAGRALALADPTGIQIADLRGIWKIAGQEVDINNPASNRGAWTISRNGRRGVLDVSVGLTMGDDEIVTGAQVSRALFVAADVISAPDALVPEELRLGNETRVS